MVNPFPRILRPISSHVLGLPWASNTPSGAPPSSFPDGLPAPNTELGALPSPNAVVTAFLLAPPVGTGLALTSTEGVPFNQRLLIVSAIPVAVARWAAASGVAATEVAQAARAKSEEVP